MDTLEANGAFRQGVDVGTGAPVVAVAPEVVRAQGVDIDVEQSHFNQIHSLESSVDVEPASSLY